jgi:hypothetical protein
LSGLLPSFGKVVCGRAQLIFLLFSFGKWGMGPNIKSHLKNRQGTFENFIRKSFAFWRQNPYEILFPFPIKDLYIGYIIRFAHYISYI